MRGPDLPSLGVTYAKKSCDYRHGRGDPLRQHRQRMFANLLEGKSGVTPTFRFNARRFPTQFSRQVLDYDLGKYVKNKEAWNPSGINTHFALGAAYQALADADVLENGTVDRGRCGVYLGSGEGIQDFPNLIFAGGHGLFQGKRVVDVSTFFRGALESFHADREAEQELHTTAAHLGHEFDLGGPNYTCLTACAASSQAIGEGDRND